MPPRAVDHRRIDEHARAGHPVDRARPNSPTGLVFPARARYELLPDGPGQGGKNPDRALRRSVGIPQAEADDARRAVADRLREDRVAPGPGPENHLATSTSGLRMRSQGLRRDSPTGINAGGEPLIMRPSHQPQTRAGGQERLGDRSASRHCRRPRSDTDPIGRSGSAASDVVRRSTSGQLS